MSASRWRWTEACEGRPCRGDCDQCDMEEEDGAEEVLILMAGAVFGVIKHIDRHITEAEKFRTMLASANVDGALDLKMAKAVGSIEALHELKRDLEAMQTSLEKMAGYDSREKIQHKPC